MNMLERIKTSRLDLPGSLRTLGVMTMLMSGVIFLFQGLSGMNQFTRFLSFAGVTMGCALLGVLCAKKLDEPKGARCLLALATSGTFVLFSQVGALLYEWLHPWQMPKVPQILQMADVTLNQLIIASGVTVLLGLAISYLGFSILDRKNKKSLTSSFLLMNILMVLPYRNIEMVLLSVAVLVVVLGYLRKSTDFLKPHSLTLEKGTALFLLAMPILTILYRSAFYELDRLLVCIQFFLFSLFAAIGENYVNREKLGRVSFPLAMLSILSLFSFSLTEISLHNRLAATLITMHGAILCLSKVGIKKVDHWLPKIWFLGTVFLASLVIDKSQYSVTTTGFLVALVGLHQGKNLKEKSITKTGLGLLLVSLCNYILIAIKQVNVFHWFNLALFAATALITASVIERQKNRKSKNK